MIRRIATVALTLLPIALVTPAVPASAGGGCHAGVTTGTGPTIEMIDACFTATITKVAPGQQVTFVNEDPTTHNVTANLWGHFEGMNQGDEFSVAFDDEGIYPFACSYHPGMTGAIVVGDAEGAGIGTVIGTTPTVPTAASDRATLEGASPVGATTDETTGAWPWLAGGAIGVAIGFGLATVAIRRRSTAAGGPTTS